MKCVVPGPVCVLSTAKFLIPEQRKLLFCCATDKDCHLSNDSYSQCTNNVCVCAGHLVEQNSQCFSVLDAEAQRLRAEEDEPSRFPYLSLVIAVGLCVACVAGLVGMVTLGRRHSEGLTTRNVDLMKEFNLWADDDRHVTKSSDLLARDKATTKRTRSAPLHVISAVSELRFKSERKQVRDGQDFGESSVDNMQKFLKMVKDEQGAHASNKRPPAAADCNKPIESDSFNADISTDQHYDSGGERKYSHQLSPSTSASPFTNFSDSAKKLQATTSNRLKTAERKYKKEIDAVKQRHKHRIKKDSLKPHKEARNDKPKKH